MIGMTRANAVNAFGNLRFHWPEYLMEAGELGLYMFSTCAIATLLQHPASPVRHVIANSFFRRAVMGLGMGAKCFANRRKSLIEIRIGVDSDVRGDFVGFGTCLRIFHASRRIVEWVDALVFALTMTFALGIKAPLDFSVFSASAGAFLLAAYGKYPLSIDALRSRTSL
jgi:hypothetical protein